MGDIIFLVGYVGWAKLFLVRYVGLVKYFFIWICWLSKKNSCWICWLGEISGRWRRRAISYRQSSNPPVNLTFIGDKSDDNINHHDHDYCSNKLSRFVPINIKKKFSLCYISWL